MLEEQTVLEELTKFTSNEGKKITVTWCVCKRRHGGTNILITRSGRRRTCKIDGDVENDVVLCV